MLKLTKHCGGPYDSYRLNGIIVQSQVPKNEKGPLPQYILGLLHVFIKRNKYN